MRQAILLGAVLMLAGFTTTAPVRTADGNWMVSAQVTASGPTGALNKALGAANSFCASQGKAVNLVSNTSEECAFHGGCGRAQITFTCDKD
jgi:hypothetical protein